MTASRNRILLSLAILALAHTGVLAAMVIDRVRLLSSGREITLPIVPVDPRDLFRGEYVRLGYDVGTVPVRLLEGPRPHENEAFYVVLEKKPDGAWQAVKIASSFPQETSPDRVVRGRANCLLDAFLAAALELVKLGADGITTNCGFLSLYQAELSAHVGVPVATSSLMQAGMIQATLPAGRRVGIGNPSINFSGQ